MVQGWISTGKLEGSVATYRIEESDHGFYLFVFKGNKQYPDIDELQDTLEIAQASAEEDWGSNGKWIKKEWDKSFIG